MLFHGYTQHSRFRNCTEIDLETRVSLIAQNTCPKINSNTNASRYREWISISNFLWRKINDTNVENTVYTKRRNVSHNRWNRAVKFNG